MNKFSWVRRKDSEGIIAPATEDESSCFGEEDRKAGVLGKVDLYDGAECFWLPDNDFPSRARPKNAIEVADHGHRVNLGGVASIDHFSAARMGIKVIDDCLVGGQIGPAAWKLWKTDNFFIFKLDLLDHLHGALLDDGEQALFATDAEKVWLNVPDVCNPFGNDSSPWPHSDFLTFFYANFGNISILGAAEETVTMRGKDKAVVLTYLTGLGLNLFDWLVFAVNPEEDDTSGWLNDKEVRIRIGEFYSLDFSLFLLESFGEIDPGSNFWLVINLY